MESGKPSRTAWSAAFHRAAHQVLEQGHIFADPLALRILGQNDPDAVARTAEERTSGRGMRVFIAVRHRFAEDALAAAVEGGMHQLVVLGAGLDTYAYRNPFGECLRVIEVDHPDTQAWKRQLLANAGIPLPDGLTFASADFERQTLDEILTSAGFHRDEPAFFTWLGVVPYITGDAVWATLTFIASLPAGGSVVKENASACFHSVCAKGALCHHSVCERPTPIEEPRAAGALSVGPHQATHRCRDRILLWRLVFGRCRSGVAAAGPRRLHGRTRPWNIQHGSRDRSAAVRQNSSLAP